MIDDSFRHYLIHIDDKDAEHEMIMFLLNQCVIDCRAGEVNRASDTLGKVFSDWKLHCASEEHFMERIKFPYTATHRESHRRIQTALVRITRTGCSSEYVAKDVRKMILEHIDQFDMQYANWYIKNNQS